jgi:hypothetical protein
LRKNIKEKVSKLLEIYEESEGIFLCMVKDKKVHIYKTDYMIVYLENQKLCFEDLADNELLLRYEIEQIENLIFHYKDITQKLPDNINICIKGKSTLVLYIL